MKKIFFAAALLVSVSLFAQKDFEGSIKYKGIPMEKESEDSEKKDTLQLEIFFAPGKIRIMASEKEDVLVFIDSAVAYILDNNDREYRRKKLRKIQPVAAPSVETIAGYKGVPYKTGTSLGMMGSMQYWLAEDLHFAIPQEILGNEEFLMIQENKIMLKVIIRSSPFLNGMDENESEEKINDIVAIITATEVKPGPVDPSIFAIPADYKEESNDWAIDTAAVAVDSAVMIAEPDTIVVPAPVKPTPIKKKPTPAPAKPKTSTKQPARKP